MPEKKKLVNLMITGTKKRMRLNFGLSRVRTLILSHAKTVLICSPFKLLMGKKYSVQKMQKIRVSFSFVKMQKVSPSHKA